jgi:hypothetical protein
MDCYGLTCLNPASREGPAWRDVAYAIYERNSKQVGQYPLIYINMTLKNHGKLLLS